MICYRDMSFCSAFIDGRCVNASCGRAFTETERAKANRWWGDVDVPVVFMDISNGCEKLKAPKVDA